MCVCQGHAICANRGYSVTLKPLSQFPVGSSSTVVSKGFQSRRFTRSVGRQPAITHSSDANTRHPRPRKQFVSTKGDRGCISFVCASRAKATTKSRNEEAWNSLPGLISRNFPDTFAIEVKSWKLWRAVMFGEENCRSCYEPCDLNNRGTKEGVLS